MAKYVELFNYPFNEFMVIKNDFNFENNSKKEILETKYEYKLCLPSIFNTDCLLNLHRLI